MFTTWAVATAVFVGASVPLQSLVLDGRVLPHVVALCMKVIAAFPVISIAYEINDFLLRHCRTGPLKVLARPGLLFARLFSVEPDDGHIEVAIAAMVRLRELEGDEALGLAPRV